MAIRFDGNAANRLTRTTDVLDYNAVYTWMAWVYITTDTNAIASILSINDATANNRDNIRTTSSGTLLAADVVIGAAATVVNGTDLTVGTWYHVAMVRESTTSLKIYLNGVLDITNTANVTGRAASNRMDTAADRTTRPWNGRVDRAKAWAAALTIDEVNAERWAIRPQRTANLYGFWPSFAGSGERARDYSGNARDWPEVGTLTDEDPAPVGWGAAATRLIVLSGVAPTVSLIAQDRTIMQRVFGRVFGRVN